MTVHDLVAQGIFQRRKNTKKFIGGPGVPPPESTCPPLSDLSTSRSAPKHHRRPNPARPTQSSPQEHKPISTIPDVSIQQQFFFNRFPYRPVPDYIDTPQSVPQPGIQTMSNPKRSHKEEPRGKIGYQPSISHFSNSPVYGHANNSPGDIPNMVGNDIVSTKISEERKAVQSMGSDYYTEYMLNKTESRNSRSIISVNEKYDIIKNGSSMLLVRKNRTDDVTGVTLPEIKPNETAEQYLDFLGNRGSSVNFCDFLFRDVAVHVQRKRKIDSIELEEIEAHKSQAMYISHNINSCVSSLNSTTLFLTKIDHEMSTKRHLLEFGKRAQDLGNGGIQLSEIDDYPGDAIGHSAN